MAIAVDNSATLCTAWSGGTATLANYTVSGSNRVLYILVTLGSTVTTGLSSSSVTYNGTGLTKLTTVTNSGVAVMELWRLIAPATGTNAVTLAYSGSLQQLTVQAISFTGVDQTTPETATHTAQQASISNSTYPTGGNLFSLSGDFGFVGVNSQYNFNNGPGSLSSATPLSTLTRNGDRNRYSAGSQDPATFQFGSIATGTPNGGNVTVTCGSTATNSYVMVAAGLNQVSSHNYVDNITTGSLALTGEPQHQDLTQLITHGALTLTGGVLNPHRVDPITPAALTLSGHPLAGTIKTPIGAGHLPLTGYPFVGSVRDTITPAHLTLTGEVLHPHPPVHLLLSWSTGPLPALVYLQIYGLAPRSPSNRSVSKRDWKLLKVTHAGASSPVDVDAEYIAAFGPISPGQLILLRLVTCNSSGEQGPETIAEAIVS